MNFEYSRTFKKDFRKLPTKLKLRFEERASIFRIDQFSPILNIHALNSPFLGYRSINVSGDIRAIFFQEKRKATFIRIGTHSELYE